MDRKSMLRHLIRIAILAAAGAVVDFMKVCEQKNVQEEMQRSVESPAPSE